MAAFVAVVEKGSFSQAGRELRLSTAVISARVAKLERDLGIRLLNRTTRQVAPTDEAYAYFEDCKTILEQVELAEANLSSRQNNPKGTIRISAPTVFGRKYVAPALAKFQQKYADINIHLHLADSFVDPLKDGFDLVIRIGKLENSSLIARKLADSPRILCASPSYIEKRGMPEKIEDLLDHNCLLLRFPGSTQFQWEFRKGGSTVRLPITGSLESNNGDVLREWALEGLGITLKSRWEVITLLRDNRLIEILTDTPPAPVSINALYPLGKILPLKMQLILDFLSQQFQDFTGA
ncbi:LysR family transcriptional regulator [Sneathiella glossodoripedis]|uniref:LysR family transcriptional regulator n=1 Tax=Sneathiella glossodoripedis TaxID=418853 RepID=UPI000A7BC613|nr:LysR family transcriptional regulator [Sneathiella glossodoripedis]